MTRTSKTILTAMLMLLALACNIPLFAGSPAQEEQRLQTAVALTVQAVNGGASLAPQPTLTTAPAQPSPSPQPTSGGAAATPLPCNKAQFLGETVADDTVFGAGESFSKTWTLKNSGSCSWNTSYRLAFLSGDALGGAASVNLAAAVAPGQQVTLSVDLQAPAQAGTYTGYWALLATDNSLVYNVSVRIQVKQAAFSITRVNPVISDQSPAACPFTYDIPLNFSSSAAGKATYYTSTSLGASSPARALKFSQAETLQETLSWTIDSSGDYWLKVYVDEPNHQWFGPYNFSVSCP